MDEFGRPIYGNVFGLEEEAEDEDEQVRSGLVSDVLRNVVACPAPVLEMVDDEQACPWSC